MASQDWFEKDFYKILGVSKEVTQDELKKVYRKLARSYHPDSNKGDPKAEARFKEISEANAVLSDPEQRKEYDAVRAMGGGARFTSGGGSHPGGFEDVFGGVFSQGARGGNQRTYQGNGGFEDLLGGVFGNGRFGQTSGGFQGYGGPNRGQDIKATTQLDFRSAVMGETVSLKTPDGRTLKVKIPAGVTNGQKIRVPGKGHPSTDGGASGDIVLTVSVQKHPVFERDGLNLRLTVPVTFREAVLGGTIEVPTLTGDIVKLRVAPGTPSGRVLRVKGRGVASAKGIGDLLAVLQLAVPSHLSHEALRALEEFDEALPDENPRADVLARAKQ